MNDTLIHADFFFFITAIAIVVLVPVLLIAGVYVIRILREARAMIQRMKAESDAIMKDVEAARAEMKREGRRLKELLGTVPVVGGVWQEANQPGTSRRPTQPKKQKPNTTSHGKKTSRK